MRAMNYRIWNKKKQRFFHYETILEGVDKNVMLDTGLKDAHGRNIFEGDIIEYDNEEGIVRAVVEYDNEEGIVRAVVEFSTDNDDQPFFSAFVPIPILIRDYVFPNNTEYPIELAVVGNIYENPELLGNKGELKLHKYLKI